VLEALTVTVKCLVSTLLLVISAIKLLAVSTAKNSSTINPSYNSTLDAIYSTPPVALVEGLIIVSSRT